MQARLDRARRGAVGSDADVRSGSESESRPALVTVVGPAGVGKTRLGEGAESNVDFNFRSSCTGDAAAHWRTATPPTRRSPTRSRPSARSSTTTPPRSRKKKVNEAVESLFGDKELVAADRRARGYGRAGRVQPGRTCSMRGGASSSGWRLATPWCWCSRTSTGPTKRCWTSLSTSAYWAQGPILLVTLARPELFENRPAWGGGKRNAVSIFPGSSVGRREFRRCCRGPAGRRS